MMMRRCVNLYVFLLLNLLGRQYDTINICLYRDDGLSIFKNYSGPHCVKSVPFSSYSGRHFPALRLNTERYAVSLCTHSECGKKRTRIISNTDTFHAVPQMKKIKKRLQKVFKNNDLDVITECEMKILNYFNITFNLNDDT